ncbi:hypothetical protein [Grimontia hollisae]|uniref:hypothetical protein n=1 Tax=Grimontia hollisae TaxID=673 RepID=UPI0013036781|nr:hypothetical protein [Grimontia hollisae]
MFSVLRKNVASGFNEIVRMGEANSRSISDLTGKIINVKNELRDTIVNGVGFIDMKIRSEKCIYISEESKKNICEFFESSKREDLVGCLEKDILRANYNINVIGEQLFSHKAGSSSCEDIKKKEDTLEILQQLLSDDQYRLLSKLACQNLVTFIINNKAFEDTSSPQKFFFLPDLSSSEAAGRFISHSQKFAINVLEDKTVDVECSFDSRSADKDYIASVAESLQLNNITGLDVKISINIDEKAKIQINNFELSVYNLLRKQ